jgi:hypothetical protein
MPTYSKPHRTKLPKRSRSRPIKWRGEASGRFYRCWNCGFVCDKDRDSLGGADSAGGDNHQDYALQTGSNYRAGIGPRPVGTLDVMTHYHVALRQTIKGIIGSSYEPAKFGETEVTFGTEQIYIGDASETALGSGAPIPVYHYHKSNVTDGCPFCGSTNYAGIY